MARKLHEIGGDVTPDLTHRIASGKLGVPTVNSTWQTVLTWLEARLGFLKTSLNLSDLNDTAAARTNLDVYATGDIDTALNLKADKTNVLERDNTDTYTPSSDYNPETVLHVFDNYQTKGGVYTSTAGGGSEGAAVEITVAGTDFAFITCTNVSQRYYKLGITGVKEGQKITVKSSDASTQLVIIVDDVNNDLPGTNADIQARDAATFTFYSSKWRVTNEYKS